MTEAPVAGEPVRVTVAAIDEALTGVVVTAELAGADDVDPFAVGARSALDAEAGDMEADCTLEDLTAADCSFETIEAGSVRSTVIPARLLAAGGSLTVTVTAENRTQYTHTVELEIPVPDPAMMLDNGTFTTDVTGVLTGIAPGTVVSYTAFHGDDYDELREQNPTCGYFGSPRNGVGGAGNGTGFVEVQAGGRFTIPIRTDIGGATHDNVIIEITAPGFDRFISDKFDIEPIFIATP
ncbi:hypothetical protein [Serinibacter arcticus]|uniref:hypothetical protein n=1 Tax=Serinibacter arcticus TaxID=1655435 RepID=UPI0011B1D5CC|nr:hypothetical protein [Serinibacter arcticus]